MTTFKHSSVERPLGPSPKPMPTTGRPDRNEPVMRSDYDKMKEGCQTTGTATFNPGKPSK